MCPGLVRLLADKLKLDNMTPAALDRVLQELILLPFSSLRIDPPAGSRERIAIRPDGSEIRFARGGELEGGDGVS